MDDMNCRVMALQFFVVCVQQREMTNKRIE